MWAKRVRISRYRKKTGDKWAKTNVLLRDRELRKYVPTTKRLNVNALQSMLDSFGMVYVKPAIGSMGKGVMRVEKEDVAARVSYGYQLGGHRSEFSNYKSLYHSLKKTAGSKRHLIQKGIHLLTYEGRRFDLRVVVQQAPSGGFETTGIVARIAFPGKIVTNGSQGGTILPAEQVLRPYAGPQQIKELLSRLSILGVNTIKALRRKYPDMKEIGVDIALDRELRPWILEVNTRPDHCPFAVLQDQTMIRRIVHYGKQYGRTYKLACHKP